MRRFTRIDGVCVCIERGGRQHVVDRHGVELRIGHEAVAVHERAFHRFHQQMVVIGAAFANRADVEALERAHDLQRRHTLRGRPHADQFAATIGHTQWRLVARLRSRQIAQRQR